MNDIWITLLILLPVVIFLMWLYWITKPADLPPQGKIFDWVVLIVAPISTYIIAILVYLALADKGIWAHIMTALIGYLVLLSDFAVAWFIRSRMKHG